MKKISKVIYAVLPVLGVATLIGAWTILSLQEGTLIPTPVETWKRFLVIVSEPISKATLPIHVLVSLKRVLLAFCFAIVLGIITGVLFGWYPRVKALLAPVFELLRPIPPIAWIPLLILMFGIGEMPKILLVFIGAYIPIVMNTHSGIDSIDPMLIKAGQSFGCNHRQLLFHVALPASTPAILAGIKMALSSGWMCVVAAEMIAAKQGVGFLIVRGQEAGDTALIVTCMLVIGVVSFLLSAILTKLEGVLCPWQFKKTK